MANRADPKQIAALQVSQRNIRNFCILAHVDHGKTTLSDSLVSSNGIISAKLAGKLRYLDSTEEEQKRGITMHSSAISLLFKNEEKGAVNASAATSSPDTQGPQQEAVAAAETSEAADEYLINLIDSPGHIDFSSDVSTATRLCDGALLVVDALEGICTQTHAVVYKALKERMRPCLVLNKIDRLFIDMKLSSTEAFQHLRRLLEQVNALAYTLLKSEVLKRENLNDELTASHTAKDGPTVAKEVEDDPLFEQWNFEPDKGNVVFCSALDCWGFSTAKFANIWSKRLGVNPKVLRKYMFDDYAYNSTTKKIVKTDTLRGSAGSKPMFASMVLDPLWQLYDAALTQQDATKAANMANKGFGVVLPPREINPRDTRATLQSILRRWLPLSEAVLRMIIRTVPDPITAQQHRLFTLLPGVVESSFDNTSNAQGDAAAVTVAKSEAPAPVINKEAMRLPLELAPLPRTPELRAQINTSYDNIKLSVASCTNDSDAPVVVFVAKMVPVRVAELSQRDLAVVNARLAQKDAEARKLAGDDAADSAAASTALKPDSEVFIALARVFSGVLKRDSPLFVLGSKYDPLADVATTAVPGGNPQVDVASLVSGGLTPLPADFTLGLYIMLGPSVVPVEQVPAGNIVGILGLSDYVLKTATLSSTWANYPMNSITFQSKPMLKVAVEPTSHVDLRSLEKGLQQLHQFDPVVEIGIDKDTGQNTMTCLGELHLEQCVKALTERFAKCQVNVSEPLIAFRETILGVETSIALQLPPPWSEMPGLSLARAGRYRVTFGSGNVAITIRCFPLHLSLVQLLEEHANSLSAVDESLTELHRQLQSCGSEVDLAEAGAHLKDSKFWTDFCAAISTPKDEAEVKTVDPALLSSAPAADAARTQIRNRVLAIGSHYHPTNMLLISNDASVSVWQSAVPSNTPSATDSFSSDSACGANALLKKFHRGEYPVVFQKLWARLHSACTAAFRMAVEAGPLMREPVHGAGFCIESIEFNAALCNAVLSPAERALVFDTENSASMAENAIGSASILTGQLISEFKDALHVSMLSLPMRIVEPVYKCDLQCDQSQLGNLYAVLSQRRGEVTNEDIIEGTSLFLLSAQLPVYNSFGFAQQLLKKTSGLGTAPQLSFSHWSKVDTDPFWRPTTEEELEEFGEHCVATERNLPRTVIDQVRKRKGLPIEEKVVMYAEKQRTLNKKK